MRKIIIRVIGAVAILASMGVLSQSAEAGLRRFYWTAESQSNAYDRLSGQQECFANAQAEAEPYAFNTCRQSIGDACDYANFRVEYLNFAGRPGLYNCKVRVWVEAFE
jgi:hypothetical protein